MTTLGNRSWNESNCHETICRISISVSSEFIMNLSLYCYEFVAWNISLAILNVSKHFLRKLCVWLVAKMWFNPSCFKCFNISRFEQNWRSFLTCMIFQRKSMSSFFKILYFCNTYYIVHNIKWSMHST